MLFVGVTQIKEKLLGSDPLQLHFLQDFTNISSACPLEMKN
jgi:hypothetical protein